MQLKLLKFGGFVFELRRIQNRSNFGEVDVAPAKTDNVNKVEK